MEDVLDLYALPAPADPKVVYLAIDEKGKELRADLRPALPAQPGQVQRLDSEYLRKGSCNIFVAYNWHTRQRHTQVTARRTAQDWAAFLYYLAMVCYPQAERIVIVCDNLNIHETAGLYELYEPALARAIAQRFEFHHTPTHASWLNMVEIELSVLESQCLNRRMASLAQVQSEVLAWEVERNRLSRGIEWQFTKEMAREKLGRAYPRALLASEAEAAHYTQLGWGWEELIA